MPMIRSRSRARITHDSQVPEVAFGARGRRARVVTVVTGTWLVVPGGTGVLAKRKF